MKIRNIILLVFVMLVAVSLIYGLADHRKVTTSSEQAYQAYLKGVDYAYRLYPKEALQEFEKAVELDPKFAMAYLRLAGIYWEFDRKEDYKQARSKVMANIADVTDKERITINLNFSRMDNKPEDIKKYSNELLQKYPDSFEAHEYLSGKYFSEKNYDKAIEENLIILRKDPNHAVSYNLLGYSYFYKGQFEKALENIEKYSSLAEDQANPHDSHGELLLNMGRYDEALVQFQKADSIKPGLSFVISHMGDTYKAKGMYRDAIGAYLKAKDLAYNEKAKGDMEDNAALCYIDMGQAERAISLLRETLSKVPDDLKANILLGTIYARQGNIADAEKMLATVRAIITKINETYKGTITEKVPSIAGQYLLGGQIAMAKGDNAAAIDEFKKTLEGVGLPERSFFNSQLGMAYVKANQPESAISVLNECLKDNPNDSRCLKTLAEAYSLAGLQEAEKGTLVRYLEVMKDADDGVPDFIEANNELQKLNSKAS